MRESVDGGYGGEGGGRGRMEKGVNGTQREQAAHSFINFRTFQSSCARSHEGSCV